MLPAKSQGSPDGVTRDRIRPEAELREAPKRPNDRQGALKTGLMIRGWATRGAAEQPEQRGKPKKRKKSGGRTQRGSRSLTPGSLRARELGEQGAVEATRVARVRQFPMGIERGPIAAVNAKVPFRPLHTRLTSASDPKRTYWPGRCYKGVSKLARAVVDERIPQL